MDQQPDHVSIAKAIIDDNIYMVIGTTDELGVPWVTPVYFGAAGYTEFYWVSSPDARHSRNIAVHPGVSIVIFNSRAPIGTGQAVYMEAVAGELSGADLETGIEIYSRSSLEDGASEWTVDHVRGDAPYRLYRAIATRHWVLDSEGHPDRRIEIAISDE